MEKIIRLIKGKLSILYSAQPDKMSKMGEGAKPHTTFFQNWVSEKKVFFVKNVFWLHVHHPKSPFPTIQKI